MVGSVRHLLQVGKVEAMSRLVSCLTWPFAALWHLLAVILELTGRLVAMLLGLVLIVLGLILTLTIVGAVVGVPIMLFGLLLIVRGLF
jgi:hypothetical protein